MKFLCETCNYLTDRKSNFDTHNTSKRHLTKCNSAIADAKPPENHLPMHPETTPVAEIAPVAEETTPAEEIPDMFPCKYCDQKFVFKQSMYRHIKYSCKKNKDEDMKELVRLLNSRIKEQDRTNDMNNKLILGLVKKIDKLMGKLEISGSFNTTNIQNIHLLPYRETDTSHLTDKDYRECLNHRNHCVKHMIEKVHFNPSKPENMNIHISNMKDKYIMIYDGVQWNIADRKREIDYLYDEKEMMLEEWLESNPDKVLRDKFMKYLNNKEDDECVNQIKEEIKMMLYNKQSVYKQLTE